MGLLSSPDSPCTRMWSRPLPGLTVASPRGQNSGLTHVIPATDISMPEVRQTFETNVFGVMAMVQAFAPRLIAARGLIVNVASLAALTPYCKWEHRAFLAAPFQHESSIPLGSRHPPFSVVLAREVLRSMLPRTPVLGRNH